jgi:hypothetical protein
VQVALGGSKILVPRQLLRDDGIPGVLRRPRAELVAQRVPDQALVAAVVETGELEEPMPGGAEVLLAEARGGSEHIAVGVVLQLVAPPAERRYEPLRARVDALLTRR